MSTVNVLFSESTEINGYGYTNYSVERGSITLPDVESVIPDGEFIINLPNGKQQRFVPEYFDFHMPSEHTVNGEHYDLELHIVHHYKGTENKLGAMLGIFFQADKERIKENEFVQDVIDAIDGVN